MPEITESVCDKLKKMKAGLVSLAKLSGAATEGDVLVCELATELLQLIYEKDGHPIRWKIGGIPILLQEFVMPILGDLENMLKIQQPDITGARLVTISTTRIAFEEDLNKKHEADSKKVDGIAFLAIQVKSANFVLVSTKNNTSKKKPREHRLHQSKIDPSPATPIDGAIDGTNVQSNLEIGNFDYKIYMRDEAKKMYDDGTSGWAKRVPLICPKHCPAGKNELREIANELNYKIRHYCPDINTAVAALRSRDCPFAAILPSYLNGLQDPSIVSIDIPDEDGKMEFSEQLRNHSLTLIWQFTHFDGGSKGTKSKFPSKWSTMATELLEIMANSIENKIPSTKGAVTDTRSDELPT